MVNSVIGICDTNTVYMKKLAEYFMQKSDIPLQIMTFSNYNQLIQYLDKECLDILITGEEVHADAFVQSCDAGIDTGQRKEEIKNHVKWRIELVDFVADREVIGNFLFKVSRYSSSAELLRLIKQLIIQSGHIETESNSFRSKESDQGICGKIHIKPRNFDMKVKGDSKRIIGIYSPVRRCGKSSLAVLFVRLLMRRGDSLMICMDHYSDIFSDEESNLAELIYCMSRESNLRADKVTHDFLEYEGFVKKWQELSYIAAPRSVEDLTQISASQLCHLIDLLRNRSHYQYIVIDFTDGMENLQLILKRCDWIVMPFLNDCISRSKLDLFEQNMSDVIGLDEWALLSDKICKVHLPATIEAECTEHYYKELIWSDFGNYASRILEQYGIVLL